jgi:hypothetical protein
LIAKLI